MFKGFKFTRKIENTLMLIFTFIFLGYISMSPDMNLESLKGVLIIGITVGIIYGLVAVGISLIYTGLDVVNFSHGEFFMLGAFTGLTVYNFLIDGELIYAIFPDAYGWVGYVIGLFFAFVVMGLFGVLIERVFLRPSNKKRRRLYSGWYGDHNLWIWFISSTAKFSLYYLESNGTPFPCRFRITN